MVYYCLLGLTIFVGLAFLIFYWITCYKAKHESIEDYRKNFGEDADEYYLLESAFMRNNYLPEKYLKRYEELQIKHYGEVFVK